MICFLSLDLEQFLWGKKQKYKKINKKIIITKKRKVISDKNYRLKIF